MFVHIFSSCPMYCMHVENRWMPITTPPHTSTLSGQWVACQHASFHCGIGFNACVVFVMMLYTRKDASAHPMYEPIDHIVQSGPRRYFFEFFVALHSSAVYVVLKLNALSYIIASLHQSPPYWCVGWYQHSSRITYATMITPRNCHLASTTQPPRGVCLISRIPSIFFVSWIVVSSYCEYTYGIDTTRNSFGLSLNKKSFVYSGCFFLIKKRCVGPSFCVYW